jgi:hypothetical protein
VIYLNCDTPLLLYEGGRGEKENSAGGSGLLLRLQLRGGRGDGDGGARVLNFMNDVCFAEGGRREENRRKNEGGRERGMISRSTLNQIFLVRQRTRRKGRIMDELPLATRTSLRNLFLCVAADAAAVIHLGSDGGRRQESSSSSSPHSPMHLNPATAADSRKWERMASQSETVSKFFSPSFSVSFSHLVPFFFPPFPLS